MRPETRTLAVGAGGLAALALLGGLLCGWAVTGELKQKAEFPPAPSGNEARTASTRLSPAGERVASGLKCPCGCPNLLLACDCGNPRGGAEAKRLIMETLGSGRGEADTRVELTNRYGAAIQRIGR